jgi:hypothetical protein
MTLATVPQPDIQFTARTLGRVTDRWLDANDPLRKEAILALQVSTGFTRSMIEQAIKAAFQELTEDKILAYLAAEPGFAQRQSVPTPVLHILAGNVFTAWLPGAVTTLLLGADCLLKPSMHERVFAPLWKRSLEQVDPVLAERVTIVPWSDALLENARAVVAYGSDETLETLQAKIAPGTRFIGYGHKISIGVIFKEALASEAVPALIETLGQDIRPFDLEGCLSPRILYVEGDYLTEFNRLPPEVTVMPDIYTFASWESLMFRLAAFKPHLSELGYAGPEARIQAVRSDLEELGFTRVCPMGQMQQPPLTWRNGGISLVDALTRR